MITVRHRSLDLRLRHTFRLSRGATDSRRNVIVELEHDGLIGLGEAAPITRYAQSAETVASALDEMAPRLGDPRHFAAAARQAAVAGQPAAEAAVDMALRDLAGKRLGVPLFEHLGLDPATIPLTSFTIAIDRPEVMGERVREALGPDGSRFGALKIKLGSGEDRAMLEAVRSATSLPLRVDANEGWTFDEALENLAWLAELGVEMVEQPLPAAALEQMRVLRERSPIPLVADESVGRAVDIPGLAGAFDVVNIKLMKCGGIGEALRMIEVARAHGLKVMLGCMIESSIAIAAAAHISPLVDECDLDGNLLIADDPFVGPRLVAGRMLPSSGPGLGVEARW